MLLRILDALLLTCIQCQQLPEPSEEVKHEPSESEPSKDEPSESEPKRNETDKPR